MNKLNNYPRGKTVVGHSMFPILQPNDFLVSNNVTFDKVKINDLLMVKKAGRYLFHRVIFKAQDYVITKGDNNISADKPTYSTSAVTRLEKIRRDRQIFSPEDIYTLQSILYFQEIVTVTGFFKKQKIQFVILKGLPIHLYYEKAHPRRIYADCDILIRDIDINKVTDILFSQGYKKSDMVFSANIEKLKDKTTEVSFYTHVNGVKIVFDIHLEINMGIVSIGRIDELYSQKQINCLSNKLREEYQSVVIRRKHFPVLSVDNMIIYLLIHLFQHGFKGAFRYDLLNTIISSHTTERIWPKCEHTIRAYNLENYIFPALLLLIRKYHTKIPGNFMKKIRPKSRLIRLLSKKTLQIDIFSDESRFVAGINRFKNLLLFSPNPWRKKIWLLCNFRVINAVGWVVWKKIRDVLFSMGN